MRRALVAGLVAFTTSIAVAQPATVPIGQTKYASTKYPANLCRLPDKLAGCRLLRSGKLTVTAPGGRGRLGERFYAVSVDDGKESGFVDSLAWILLQTEEERKQIAVEAKSCANKGGARVGMTKDQVVASCWGKPKSVNSTTTARGTREQWVYGRSYLYFDETGVLTAIQH